jgi:hypothetical protein
MFPRTPRVLIDNKVVDAAEVQSIVVKTTVDQFDAADVTVASSLQTPTPTYRMGANLQVKLALGGAIFEGRIVGIQPGTSHAGHRQWLVRGHGPMRFAQPQMANDVRIAEPIRTMNVQIIPQPEEKNLGLAKVTLDPEIDSVKFSLGQTKQVSTGPGTSFTGSIVDIERRYAQSGANQITLVVKGWMPKPSTR